MDARRYLEQVRCQLRTIRSKQMDLEEARDNRDFLRCASPEAGAKGGNARLVEKAVERYEEIEGAYIGELLRWTAMHDQAVRMLDRARAVLCDGHVHAIDLTSIEVLHRYYLKGWSRGQIADEFGLSASRVDDRKREALLWLDENRGADGMPLVPIVSE